MTRAELINALGCAIDDGDGVELNPEADLLARELYELVHDRGAGDIGDIRAAIKRLAVHFPRSDG